MICQRQTDEGRRLRHSAEMRRWRAAHPEAARAADHRNYVKHSERRRAEKRRYRTEHPEKERAAKRRYRIAHPEEVRERGRRWYAANPEKVRAKVLRYRAANLEKVRAREHRYRVAHPEVSSAAVHRHRVHVQSNGGPPLTVAVMRSVKDEAGGLCSFCMVAAPLTIEHFIPVSRGGTNDWWNLAAVCQSCNSSKQNKTPLECGVWVPPLYRRLDNAVVAWLKEHPQVDPKTQ